MLHVQEVHIHVCAKAARGGQGRTKDVQGHSRAHKMCEKGGHEFAQAEQGPTKACRADVQSVHSPMWGPRVREACQKSQEASMHGRSLSDLRHLPLGAVGL